MVRGEGEGAGGLEAGGIFDHGCDEAGCDVPFDVAVEEPDAWRVIVSLCGVIAGDCVGGTYQDCQL